MSRTRSSATSPSSSTTSRLPCAESADSTSSVFILPSRSRCSTTTAVTFGSASSLRTFARDPLIPDPTSASTRTTRPPASAAQVVSLATCRSRSSRWSWEDTRAYSPYAAAAGPAGASGQTSTVRWFTRTAGTGNVPSRNHRYAVCGCTP